MPVNFCPYVTVKRAVITFNVFFWFTGPCILGLGIWYFLNIKLYSPVIDKEQYIVPAYVVMGTGIAISLFGIIGCLGSINDNKSFIAIFLSFILLVFSCEVFATVRSFLIFDKVSSLIEMRLEYSMKYLYHYNKDYTYVINSIQSQLQCCGYDTYSDWQYYRYYRDPSLAVARGRETVPVSCCLDTNNTSCNAGTKVPRDIGKIYNEGCRRILERWIKQNIMIFGWTCFAMSSVQIVGLVLSCCFYKAIKDTRN